VKHILTAIIFVILLMPFQSGHTTDLTLPATTPVKVCFSPDGGCNDAINKALS
jgi:hypothetical protein